MENDKMKKNEELKSRRDFFKKQQKVYYLFWVQ